MKPFLTLFLFLALPFSFLRAQHLRYNGTSCEGFYRFVISHKHCGITNSYLHYNLRANLRRRWFRDWLPCWTDCWEATATVDVRLVEESSVVLWTRGMQICPRLYRNYLARVRAHEAKHRQADEKVFASMNKVLSFAITGAPSEAALREMVQARLDREKKAFGDKFNNLGRPLHREIDRERCNSFFNCAQCK